MARTDAQRDRSQYRKTQQMIENTHGGNAGRSILEMLGEQLDRATLRYLEAKDDRVVTDVGVAQCRGEIRGLARAIALMQNPYRPIAGIKQAEKDSASRVRRTRHAEERNTAE